MRISAFENHFRRRSVNFSKGTLGLWVAAFFGLQEIVKILLGTGVHIGAKNSCTSTALHAAASNGQEAVVRLLLEGLTLTQRIGLGKHHYMKRHRMDMMLWYDF
jgi:ankyrin repeat protein